MKPTVHIELVDQQHYRKAMRFLAGGDSRDGYVVTQAKAFEELARSRGQAAVKLWWARRRRRCVAAAMIVENPGRTAMLYHSSAAAGGVDIEALTALVTVISKEALEKSVSLVQSILSCGAAEDIAMLASAGFEQLAELVYMELAPASAVAPQEVPGLTWKNHEQFTESQLGDVIAATYVGSLDCPAICGVRRMKDVIAGHKAGGVFRPDSWWIVELHGVPAGCILMNDSRSSSAGEIVYFGVVPSCRGKGLGAVMLRRAAAETNSRGRTKLTLAVDAANVYARKLYESEGFRCVERRLAYVMLAQSAGPVALL